jgi:ABC-2 type transport system permease protein
VTSLLALYLDRARFEIKMLLRDRRTVMFSMLLPVFLLAIFGSVFNNQKLADGVSFAQYFVAGMLASGLLYSSFQLLAIAIPEERTNGTLKRLVGSPMPRSVYFVGKFGCSLFIYVTQAIVLLAMGHFAYHVHLPTAGAKWFEFAWISLLGLVVSSLLGIAFSTLARDGKSASAMAAPLVLFFQFTSGVYFIYANLPAWMQHVSALFPLKWMAQAMRGVFLPQSYAGAEVSHSFEFARAALVLGAWTVVAALLCRFTFRWMRKDES